MISNTYLILIVDCSDDIQGWGKGCFISYWLYEDIQYILEESFHRTLMRYGIVMVIEPQGLTSFFSRTDDVNKICFFLKYPKYLFLSVAEVYEHELLSTSPQKASMLE